MNLQISPPTIARWSTDDIPPSQRFDYFANALTTAIVPMRVESGDPKLFTSSMTIADLGPVSVLRQTGTPHRSYRRRGDLACSGDHTFHLIVNLASPWTIRHREEIFLERGDGVLTDSNVTHDLHLARPYEVVHLKLSANWVHRWIRSPEQIVGKRLPLNSTWGRPLMAYAAQLSPQAVLGAPVAPSVIVDQVGALLALVASELSGSTRRWTGRTTQMRNRIEDCMAQRCMEPCLDASAVAKSLSVEVNVIHETLRMHGQTFGELLVSMRTNISVRMLTSPAFRLLSVSEIGRRAGFADMNTFSRTLRTRCGLTATQLRRRGHGLMI
ncbi:helix-turn-helix transcriptional regulator [Variovorax sp. Sphag1AA]|uniref:AraC family transcriptional regulator n=1 Tax=Variovorax sp. Sphag1AA TaxID=2587027 RepID=UPI00161EF9B2|nr:helix-turn-helix transcriptional regulator [Variovorax sp. Sphag1AA]MBB3178135.1 AraC-like DNA-binding protein [Variovorax sp. Sphag1AA]